MRLFPVPSGAVGAADRSAWLTPPFDLGWVVQTRRGLLFRFRARSSAVAFDASEVIPMQEWPESTVFAGAAVRLRGTLDVDKADQVLRAWAYPDGEPGSAVRVAEDLAWTGARTFEGVIAAAATAGWAGLRIVVEVWFESSDDPVAWGAFYFLTSGRPS